jgi:hypothetical protein
MPGPPPSPAPSPALNEPPTTRDTARAAARADLDRAQASLEASASDCTAACRALASMERAAVRLCTLAGAPDDARRCDDAKQRLVAARDRVRLACGTCPGGPTVEHGAPLPRGP